MRSPTAALSLGLFCALALASLAPPANAATRYVNVNLQSGANDGSSWDNAYRGVNGVALALVASTSGDQVWVAAGTYKPTTATTRTAYHTLKTGVAVYGGFVGDEATLEERDIVAYETILSGDLLGNDTPTSGYTENSYHVIYCVGTTTSGTVDGFTIKGGYANSATSNQDKGGAVLILSGSAPTFRDCRFERNRCTFGGGVGYVNASSPTFERCTFADNTGGGYGGGFDMSTSVNATFNNCQFLRNSAARAGAVEAYSGTQFKATNCIFVGNTCSNSGANAGGAVWSGVSSTSTLRNCTFSANQCTGGTAGGGFLNAGGTSSVINCIFWANTGSTGSTVSNQITNSGGTTAATYSTIQNGYTGTGNTSVDPLFVDAVGGNHRLQDNSPSIDAGANSGAGTGNTVDLDGNPRFVDHPGVVDTGIGTAPIVDRGAYESQVAASPCSGDSNADGLVDAVDLANVLAGWGASGGNGDVNADGTIDGVDLALVLGGWGACP
ncbi:MAG: hypothetical protein O2819_05190 [Planctomycetota bacterium]|nr:hypothetical protein [Planctomycetota bacterium]